MRGWIQRDQLEVGGRTSGCCTVWNLWCDLSSRRQLCHGHTFFKLPPKITMVARSYALCLNLPPSSLIAPHKASAAACSPSSMSLCSERPVGRLTAKEHPPWLQWPEQGQQPVGARGWAWRGVETCGGAGDWLETNKISAESCVQCHGCDHSDDRVLLAILERISTGQSHGCPIHSRSIHILHPPQSGMDTAAARNYSPQPIS